MIKKDNRITDCLFVLKYVFVITATEFRDLHIP